MAVGSRVIASKNYGYTEAQFFTDDLSIFSLFFFHFPFLIFLPRIFKLKSLIIKLFHKLKKDKWLTDKFSFENEGPSETSKIKSVASIYARAYPDVQLNYGKKLFPEKEFFYHQIDRDDWYIFRTILVCLWYYFSYDFNILWFWWRHMRKQCTLPTTLEMGKNRQLTSAFSCVLICWKRPAEKAGMAFPRP